MLFECYPEGWHPYQEQFSRAMAPYGFGFRPGKEFSNQAIKLAGPEIAGIHFHWIEYLWSSPTWHRSLRHIVGLWRYCNLVRRLGKKIVWTVHNHTGHENKARFNKLGFRIVASAADLIIVHSKWSEGHVRETFRPRAEIVHMPLGNFDGMYQPVRSASEVRASFGLSNAVPLAGMIGGMRPYRGHELAIEAVKRLKGKCQLLIAGHPIDLEYRDRILRLAEGCPWIACQMRNLTDTEYAELVLACDLQLLPYEGITGSAAMLAAWTLARPVVTSDLPFFVEMRSASGAAGLVMPERSPEALAACIQKLLDIPVVERNAAARAEADRYPWKEVIKPVALEFERLKSSQKSD